VWCSVPQCAAVCCSVLHCAAVCCSVLQCAAVCCSVLQCAAVCCRALNSHFHHVWGANVVLHFIENPNRPKNKVTLFHTTLSRGWRLRKKKEIFFFGTQPKKKHPGPDGPNASGWYGRLREPISPLYIDNQVWSNMTAILWCVALLW